ncbi:MAG: hypothetical protein H0W02_04795 [Ktedonobacteraceae bacterium]|nr:hypothetical protein [Ktedonobacteraceae bacterium]
MAQYCQRPDLPIADDLLFALEPPPDPRNIDANQEASGERAPEPAAD